MTKKQQPTAYIRIANGFGVLGYTSVFMQWLWLFATLILPLANNPSVREWLIPTASTPSEELPVLSPELPNAFQLLLIVLSFIFIIAVIAYLIKSVPKAIGQTGKTITQGSTKLVVSRVAHQRKLPAKEAKKLFERITWIMKLALLALPMLALTIPVEPPFAIEYLHVVVFGIFCGAWSLVWFALQFAVVRHAKIDLKKVW
jgi:hypothetical protein